MISSHHLGSCLSRLSTASSSFPSSSSATIDLLELRDCGRSVLIIIIITTIIIIITITIITTIIIIITIIIITIKIIQVLFHWDGLYWFFVILFGISGGYTASLALMYCPRWLIFTIIIANIPIPSSTLYLLSSLTKL